MGEPALKIENLSLEKPRVKAISLTLKRGEVIGIYPNQEGKAIASAIKGLLDYEGSISGEIAYLPEKASLYLNLTLEENLEFFAMMHGVRERKRRVREVLKFLEMKEFSNTFFKDLDEDLRKRAAAGVAILSEPSAMLIEEPHGLWEVIERLRGLGVGVLVLSSKVKELGRCDRIIIVKRRIYEFKAERLRKECVLIKPFKMEKAMAALDEFGFKYMAFESEIKVWVDDSRYAIPELVEMLLRRGIRVERVESAVEFDMSGLLEVLEIP
jgi:ABC-2 type transport system ATP-binding protein